MGAWDKILGENGSGFLVGKSLTIADLRIFGDFKYFQMGMIFRNRKGSFKCLLNFFVHVLIVGKLDHIPVEHFGEQNYPNLNKFAKLMSELPQLRKYRDYCKKLEK